MFHIWHLAVCRNYKLFPFLFRPVPSIPQSASSLSESFGDVRHLPSSKLSHAILNWILGIIGWSRMGCVNRQVTGTAMVS